MFSNVQKIGLNFGGWWTGDCSAGSTVGVGCCCRLWTLRRNFGGVLALSDVSFEVPAGRVVGLIGPNGSGKTTLLNMISGFYQPTAGRILFDGEVVNVYIENGQPVQYGERMFAIRTK